MTSKTERRPESQDWAVELIGLCKTFGQVRANSDVTLRVKAGSIHAIVGENGAGKTTAMKMLYGMIQPDSGEIRVHGIPRRWRTSFDAIAAGIGMVHQHFMLAERYDALENIILGAEGDRRSQMRWLPSLFRPLARDAKMRQLRELSERHGLPIDWDSEVEALPVGVKQRIEILKLLYREARILILDEPTAVLMPHEIEGFFAYLRKLKGSGHTILIITHKLKEVMALADDVTVFRAGKVAGRVPVSETSPAQLAELMVGRKVSLSAAPPIEMEATEAVLRVEKLGLNPKKAPRLNLKQELKGLSFEVRRNEIVGIAGVEGSGQRELLEAIFHPSRCASGAEGEIRILGKETLSRGCALSSAQVRALGIGFIPPDRHREAVILGWSVRDNFLLGRQRRAPFCGHGILSGRELREHAERAIEDYDVRPRDLSAPMSALSGGNQQKMVIARELWAERAEEKPGLIVACHPTRGVDVGAIEFIHGRLLQARAEGAGVLLISSELEELLSLSDRVMVMFAGRIGAEFRRGQVDERALGLAMGGAK